MKQWVEEGGSTNDKEIRGIAYSKAIKRITEQAYWVPMHTYVNDLRLLEDAQLHAVPGRAATVLPGEVELTNRSATGIAVALQLFS